MPRAAAGASCASNWCLEALFCNSANICETPRAVGAPCSSVDSCALPAFCDPVSSICTAPRNLGESCNPDGDAYRLECAAGLACAYIAKTCVQPQLNGAGCSEDDQCLSGSCSFGTCATIDCIPYCDTHVCGFPI
jgi:hypothetical protein